MVQLVKVLVSDAVELALPYFKAQEKASTGAGAHAVVGVRVESRAVGNVEKICPWQLEVSDRMSAINGMHICRSTTKGNWVMSLLCVLKKKK